VVGDLVAHGPRPAEVLRRLAELPKARFVRGNTDRYVLTGDLPAMIGTAETVRTADEITLLVDAARSMAWTRGAITAAGFLPWLASLPMEDRLTLPDGTRTLLVHASPGTDDGRGLGPSQTDAELRQAITGAEAELIFAGHTHQLLDRTIDDVRIVNDGSVSLSPTADRRACWTLITADAGGHLIESHRAAYDLGAVRDDLDRVGHPSAGYLRHRLRDQVD
jgi:predicted phosphodiesterase